MTDETQDWLTLWQTELAGMAADPDWSARMVRVIQAVQALGAFGNPWPLADDAAPGVEARAAATDAASVAERLGAIERRLAALEPRARP